MAYMVEARYGLRVGDDDGCFAAALESVRRFGGVLEHPAYSFAWKAFELPRPGERDCSGLCVSVRQADFGHLAEKATWLYCVGVELPVIPLVLGDAPMVLNWARGSSRSRPLLAKRLRAATPPLFAAWLLSAARSYRPS